MSKIVDIKEIKKVLVDLIKEARGLPTLIGSEVKIKSIEKACSLMRGLFC
jgi:hypothetical protein